MKTRITSPFTGYPGAPEDQTARDFAVGEEPDDLTPDYVDLLVRKGLAERVAETPAEPIAEIAAEPASETPAEASAEPDTQRSRRAR